MKRIVMILISAFLLFSTSRSEGLDESPLYGTYMQATEFSDGEYAITLFHLFADHTGYYMSEWVEDGEYNGAHEEMITWTFTKEAKVQIALEHGILEFSMGNYGQLLDSSKFTYTKVYPRRDWQ